jgi:hypothetical protein
MARNLYYRRVKYSFVECYTTVASSQEEANAKFEESIKSNRNEPVGCLYRDLDAEITEDRCEYEEKAKDVVLSNEEIVDAMRGRLLSREQIDLVENLLGEMLHVHNISKE